jgi:hypothetical protein
MQNPAADVAAQVAAALALSAKLARDHGTADDQAAAVRWEELALRAYTYAKGRNTVGASCSNSGARGNCKGTGCSGGAGVRAVQCTLSEPELHQFAY